MDGVHIEVTDVTDPGRPIAGWTTAEDGTHVPDPASGERVRALDANEGDWQRLAPEQHDELNGWTLAAGISERGLIQRIELLGGGTVRVSYLADEAGEPARTPEDVAIVGQAYPSRTEPDGTKVYDEGPLRAALVIVDFADAPEPPDAWPRVT
jgi:hypothetical protein